jgi:prepilin-type N-terminal cleavage/methylation domain-containing protein
MLGILETLAPSSRCNIGHLKTKTEKSVFFFLVPGCQRRHTFLCDCGLTLIEILLTATVFTILLSIAIPNWSTLFAGYQLNSAAQQVSTDLQSARNRAMAQYRKYRVVPVTSTTYRVEREQTPGGSYVVFTGPKAFPSGITAIFNNTPVFQTRGNVSPGATITLTNSKGQTKQVEVSQSGRIEIR